MHLLVKAEIFAVDIGEIGRHYHAVVKCGVEIGFDFIIIGIDFNNGKSILPICGGVCSHTVEIELTCFCFKVEQSIFFADVADADLDFNAAVVECTEVEVDAAVGNLI